MHYDALIVLGRGIDQKGDIPEPNKIVVRKAVELLNQGQSGHLIFSGKWSYHSELTFPITEAEAMRNYAVKIGIKPEIILLEKESEATITNICNIKREILEPKDWRNIMIVGLKPLKSRILEISHYVLGDKYKVAFLGVDFDFPDKNHLVLEEKRKMREDILDFFQDVTPGNDMAIYQKAMDVINQRRQYPLK